MLLRKLYGFGESNPFGIPWKAETMHRAICSAIADVFRTYPDINLIRQDDGIYLDNIQKADEAFAGSHVASGLQRQYLDVPGDNAFKSALTEVNEYFESKKIPLPIMYKYILAVNNMTVDFDGKSTPVSVVDFDTNKRRLPVLLGLDKGFDLEVRPEAEAKAAFINGHLLGYPVREDDPEKLKDIDADAALVYTEKMKRPPSEFVLAGGDASRFLLIFKALQDNLKDCSQTYIDDNFLKEMAGNKKYKDIKPVLEKGVNGLKEALDFPAHWFSLSRGNIRELEITNEGILTNDLRILADEVLRENGQLPKAMIYALRIIGHNYDVYVNYLTAKILNMIRQCEENDSYIPGRLYVMVKDDDMRKAQKKSVDAMAEDKIFDSDNMEICFIDRCADGIPVDTNGHFLFDQDGALVLTSAGHGPALGKAVNYARQQRGVNEPKDRDGAVLALSFHTIDNIAPSVFKNNVVLENGCHYENKLRNVLLRTFEGNVNDADRLKSFIAAFNALGWEEKNQRPFVPKETESLNVMLARFVQERWNHMLDATGQTPNNVEFVAKADWSAKKVLDAIKDLPISIISVVSPNADDKGGGLHLDANGYFQVVDKSHYKDAGQEKTKNFKMYFNPMDFAILTTKDLPEDFEDGLIFVSDKEYGQPSIKIRQGESASTHLVSNPAKVLSRFVITPEKERNDIFLPSKTIDATNSSNLRTANEQLERDMLWFAVRRLRKIHSQTNGQDEIYGLIRRTLEDIDQKGYENENMSKDDEAALNALRACKNFAANEKAIEKARKDIELNEEIIEKAKDRGTDKNSVEKAKKNIEANKDVIEKAEKYLKENKEKIEEEKKRLKDYANSVYERIRGSDGRELPFIEEIVVREQRRLFYTRINFDQEAIGRRPFLKTVNNTGKELLELLKYVSMQAAQLGLPLEECIRMLGYTGKFLSNIYRDYSSRKVESADAANDSTGSGGGNPQGQNKEQE